MNKFLPILGLLVLTACIPSAEEKQITLLDGTPASLDELIDGKPAVVNFWASWCVFCRDELPIFEKLSKEYPEIQFVGINLQEKSSTANNYWSDGGYTFPSLLDPNSELKARFEIFTQPTTFFLDENGIAIFRKDGPMDEEEIREWVERLAIEDEDDSEDSSSSAEATEDRKDSEEKDEMSESAAPVAEIPLAPSDDTESVSNVEVANDVPRILISWYEAPLSHTIDLSDIKGGGPAKDGIPAIDNPKFTSNADRSPLLRDDDIGLLYSVGNDVRFYPFRALNWHEIVNDDVGGKKVAVTYCPLCATAVVYDRTISAGLTTFGVSGMLYQSNMLMYDRKTETLWNQATGDAVVGPLTGERTPRLKSDIVRLKNAITAHPNLKILSLDTGFARDYGRDPYSGYERADGMYFPVNHEDDRLFSKELIYGVDIDGVQKAYTIEALAREGRISDSISGIPLSITYNTATEEVTMVRTDLNKEVIPVYSFWFSWVTQFPETELHS